MELERVKLQQLLLENLPNLLAPMRCENSSCSLAGFEAAGFIRELNRINLWPLSISSIGIAEFLRKLAEFREPDICVVTRRMDGWFTGCEYPHLLRSFVDELSSIRHTTETAYEGYDFHKKPPQRPNQSIHAVQFDVRTNSGFQGRCRLNGCRTVEGFFQLMEGVLGSPKDLPGFESIFVELPWAVGLHKAIRIRRGDSNAFAALMNRMSDTITETGNEDAVFGVNVCPTMDVSVDTSNSVNVS